MYQSPNNDFDYANIEFLIILNSGLSSKIVNQKVIRY